MQLPIDSNLFVVQWSKTAKCFHTDTIKEMLEKNHCAYMENRASDYLVVAFANTYSEGQKIIAKLEEKRAQVQPT
jgi:hypothetical protein